LNQLFVVNVAVALDAARQIEAHDLS